MPTAQAASSLLEAVDNAANQRPGSEHIAALRREQRHLWQTAEVELHSQLRSLGNYLAGEVNAVGGLVLETTARERVNDIIASANLSSWVRSRFLPVYDRLYGRIARSTINTLGKLNIPVRERDKIAGRLIAEGGKRLGLIDFDKGAKESLLKIISIAQELHIGPRAAAAMIADIVPRGRWVKAGNRYRSRLIAKSEMLHAQRIASIEVYKRSKVVKELVAFDGDSDGECLARNGAYMSFAEAFAASHSTHPQCVLAFGPVT